LQVIQNIVVRQSEISCKASSFSTDQIVQSSIVDDECVSQRSSELSNITLGKIERDKTVGANDCTKKTFKRRTLPEQIKVNAFCNSLNTLMQHTFTFLGEKRKQEKSCQMYIL
jgi:hypothetical protein